MRTLVRLLMLLGVLLLLGVVRARHSPHARATALSSPPATLSTWTSPPRPLLTLRPAAGGAGVRAGCGGWQP